MLKRSEIKIGNEDVGDVNRKGRVWHIMIMREGEVCQWDMNICEMEAQLKNGFKILFYFWAKACKNNNIEVIKK